MSIPQNFKINEQRILSVTATSGSTQFTNTNSAASPDLWIKNGGTKSCQVAIGAGLTAPTAVADAAANGTTQIKVLAGESMVMKKDAATFIAGITEGSDITTLYLFAGTGS